MENTFNLKKFLAEGKLLKEEQTSNLEQINPDFTPDKIVTTSKYADNNGKLKFQFGKQSYDFGGSEDPIPNSIVVDDAEPEGNNEWIQFDLNKVGKFPPKKYINLTFTIDYINNQNNLIKTILNSLESGGILVISENTESVSNFYNKLKSNFDVLEVYDFMGNLNEGRYTPEEEQEMINNIRKQYTINGVYYDPYYPLPPGLKYDNEMGGDGEDDEVDESLVMSLVLKKK